MDGLLLVDKPKGWTSFDVVNYVRRIIANDLGKKPKSIKVGHTGTLDPAATGLLVLCIGKYTKKVPELIKHNKTYIADITFGAKSSTGDSEGELVKDNEVKKIDKTVLEKAIKQFEGDIDQTPPTYSAIKVNGKRAYELARAGKAFNIKPRTISIHSIKIISFDWPKAKIRCSVGSGTYIRVLAEDIGKSIGVPAYLSGLRRVTVDKWCIGEATDPKSLDIDTIREKLLA